MINITKSQPGPIELLTARNYNIPEVVEALKVDSHDKCYICERKNPSSIEIEHFVSHQGNRVLQLDWNNLFFACRHCNNSKSTNYDNMLNCTLPADDIEGFINFKFIPFPKEYPQFDAIDTSQKTLNTISLLEKVYIGETAQKKLEASYLRDNLLDEILDFLFLIREYFKQAEPNYKNNLLAKIGAQLYQSSAYTAFKRRYVRDKYMAEFGHFLP